MTATRLTDEQMAAAIEASEDLLASRARENRYEPPTVPMDETQYLLAWREGVFDWDLVAIAEDMGGPLW
jgi:hypothetical protein